MCAAEESDSREGAVEEFGIRRCPHCEHAIRDPGAASCIYCGLPLRSPVEAMVLLEIPRGLLRVLAAQALTSGKSGWHVVRELRRVCLETNAAGNDETARWAAWLVLSTLLGEVCFDWSQPETFVRNIATGEVDYDRLRDSSHCGFSVKRFHADGSPHQVLINGNRLEKLPGAMREEAEAVLGRYRNIEPERMQELREKLAFSLMRHQRSYWAIWERLVTTIRWMWWLAIIVLVLILLTVLHFLNT